MPESQILVIKLITGQEILGSVEFVDDYLEKSTNKTSKVIITNPVALINTKDGQLAMASLLQLSNDDKINIDLNNILYYYQPKEDIISGYKSEFSGGIIAPILQESQVINSPFKIE